jgi:hypothetical protein
LYASLHYHQPYYGAFEISRDFSFGMFLLDLSANLRPNKLVGLTVKEPDTRAKREKTEKKM